VEEKEIEEEKVEEGEKGVVEMEEGKWGMWDVKRRENKREMGE